MKIVFINLKDTVGGAVIAMNRLAAELEKDNSLELFFVVGRKKSSRSNVFSIRNRAERIIEERIIDPITRALGLQYLWFPFSSTGILREVKRLKPDVINLHLTHGAYFQTSLLKRLSTIAPIAWTLHDMWPITGNSAHTFGNESWKHMGNSRHLTAIYPSIGLNTGKWLLKHKRAIYRASDLTIITPSKWLHKLVSESPVLAGKEIVHINNGLDLSVFSPTGKREARLKSKLPPNEPVIMFSAAYLKGDIWKGGDHLIEILKRINGKTIAKIHLLLIGSGETPELKALDNFELHQTGYVSDEAEMATFLSASDLFIYPTKADNLPNVLVEAISCAVPCVTFDIGGCSEIIIHNYNGVIVKPFDFDAIVESVLFYLNHSIELQALSVNAREHAKKEFDVKGMATIYKKLFQELKSRYDQKID